jgi:NADPH:quinone reductase-like Zn-dependent oxidoreductase
MRVITQAKLGGPEVLELTQRPQPVAGPTEVLVRVTAAGVNPLDWKTRARGAFLGQPPFTVGADVAGVIAATLHDDSTIGHTIDFRHGDTPIAEAIRG